MEKHGRRDFIKYALAGSAGAAVLGGGAAGLLFDTYRLQTSYNDIAIDGLPKSFEGFRIAHLTDLHLSDNVRFDYIARAIKVANSLKPDILCSRATM